MTHKLLASAMISVAALLSQPAIAVDGYPNRPVRIINPFSPGTAIETVGRTLSMQLLPMWKQPVVIESKTGAGGLIGAGMVASASPDGYTLLVTSHSPITVAPVLNERALTYDPVKDLVPLWGLGSSGTMIAVTNSMPVKTLDELIRYVKANPDKVSYASSGVGSTMHLTGEHFIALSGAKMTHVPYRGAAPATTDVIGGQVQVLVDGAVNQIENVKSGRLRAIAIIGDRRVPELPDVPTTAESGLKGLSNRSFFAFFAPRKNLPPELLKKLRADIARAMSEPEALKMLQAAGLAAQAYSGEELEQRIQSQLEVTRQIVKAANIKAD